MIRGPRDAGPGLVQGPVARAPGFRLPVARLLAGLALVGLLAACAARPPVPWASLPGDSVLGAGDPTRAAIITTAYAFGATSVLANDPGLAAEAVARLEYLSVEIPTGPRWISFNPLAGVMLQQGAARAREALAIAPGAPPQAVIDGLFAVRRALVAGDRAAAEAALYPAVFTAGGAGTITRLASLPPNPEAAAGGRFALREMTRSDPDLDWP